VSPDVTTEGIRTVAGMECCSKRAAEFGNATVKLLSERNCGCEWFALLGNKQYNAIWSILISTSSTLVAIRNKTRFSADHCNVSSVVCDSSVS